MLKPTQRALMRIFDRRRAGAVALAAVLLNSACSSIPPQPANAGDAVPAALTVYRASFAEAGQRYAIDPVASELRVYVYRGGRAAKLGHNHVLSAPRLQGQVLLPGDDPAQAQFSLRLRLDELQVDDPALRERTGGGFADARSNEDIEGTRRNLLKSLEAVRYPDVIINSLSVRGDWPVLVADVALTLHGVTRIERLPLRVQRDADGVQVRGSFAIRQSDFGVTPYALLGGLLAVEDPLVIEFSLRARPASP